MKAHPYLNFDGNAEEAFNFYKKVFGGDLRAMKMTDAPESEKLSKNEKDRVMHISLTISEHITLMASDILPSMGHKLTVGNNHYISLHPRSREEADRIFNQLSEGGHIEMPINNQFWGDYFGSFEDKFGIKWMINYNKDN